LRNAIAVVWTIVLLNYMTVGVSTTCIPLHHNHPPFAAASHLHRPRPIPSSVVASFSC
jgi:hypothetical protein